VTSTETMPAGMDTDKGGTDATLVVELLRRERADFLNYKRRVELERSMDREETRAEIVGALLPLLDELDRAFNHLPGAIDQHPWVQGVALSRRYLEEALRVTGIERIGVAGERFDPSLHEAVAYEQQSDLDDPMVAAVERSGFRLGPRLIRAARVRVAGPSFISNTIGGQTCHCTGGLRNVYSTHNGAHHDARNTHPASVSG
jgi:molecular chaperone GrpE